ncbi:MAG: hypothetical protein A2428_10660 [Bdellovibrionales bacterium RIFOXYC1_FULL_54_43]|nr:MAG: hypothetical protein A2428_10660 [Bdellovibrionales bacterium RIFOXYC1_FULL_54_43]OFZ85364.1 MAG: hypothetical protein A2603_05435 [Bdellovibrionales bacterium RIFOXYD1_FULL_55_31]
MIGSGISGLTAAWLLKKAGRTVAVVDKASVASGESGHTTAHITELIDSGYHKLISHFGENGARMARESSRAAIDQIAANIDELGIDCYFRRVPAYIYCESSKQRQELERELDAMHRVGIKSAKLVREVPLPFRTFAGLLVPDQAQFHPVLYYRGLAEAIDGHGCSIIENTFARDVSDGNPCSVDTDRGEIRGKRVLVLTDSPMSTRFLMHTKIASYRTYVLAATCTESIAPGLFWDTADPYHYTRTQEMPDATSLLVIGGEDHKTGMKRDTNDSFEKLERWSRERFSITDVRYHWSGQVVEPVDGLPFIGRSPLSRNVYLATGYSGNGMTFGTLAGMILSDEVLEQKNSWSALYDASRVKVFGSVTTYVNENKDYPLCLFRDRISPPEVTSLEDIPAGEGRIAKVNEERLAVFRDARGELHAVSPACTHLGCHVRFNEAEESWDCPCHGSRFGINGEVLHGPAVSALRTVDVSAEQRPKAKPKKTAA